MMHPLPALLVSTILFSASADAFSAKDSKTEARLLYVDASAAPGGDGSASKPFNNPQDAAEAVRLLRESPVRVILQPGHYVMRNGFYLGAADDRAADAQVSYETAEPGKARISSGVVVDVAKLRPVSDPGVLARLQEATRSVVREVSLDELEVKATRFPDRFRGIDLLEVYWNGERLPLSRWPEQEKFASMEKVIDNGIGETGGVFVYRGDAPARWVGALEDGVWLRGFWRVPWVIEGVRVSAIDPEKRTITHAVPISNGIGSKYHRAPGNGAGEGSGEEPWEAVNLIEEIDQPGEWAVRFSTRMLYLYPPSESGELLVTDHRKPVISLSGVSNTSFTGLAVDGGLGDGIAVKGGANVLIAGCRVANVARNGIVIDGGEKHTVLSCDVTETGYSGISYLGGVRATLTPAGHRILNNLVTKAGRFFPAGGILGGGSPGAEAVGNLIAHNRIHDCANSGIVYAGNENLFEYNEIYRVGLGSSDLGCFYTNSGWTSRGNIIRNNFVHHSMNANAFYVDDGDAGDTFTGNVAYKTQSGGFIGGGHDQTFRHNVIVANTRAMHIDARGVARGYTLDDSRLRGDLESVPFLDDLWKSKYPKLSKILDTQPQFPSGILIEENLFVGCETPLRKSDSDDLLRGLVFQNNVVSKDMENFVDPAALDFSLRPDAPVFSKLPNFPQVPMHKIGLYADAYRPVVPARDMELLRAGTTTGGGFDSLMDVEASNRKKGE